MRRLKVILDDGTPNCLPVWARREIVDLRLHVRELENQAVLSRLRVQGPTSGLAALREVESKLEELGASLRGSRLPALSSQIEDFGRRLATLRRGGAIGDLRRVGEGEEFA